MSRAFKTAIDLEQNEVRNLRLHQLAAPPVAPGIGQCYYDTTDAMPYVWDGAAWVAMAGGDLVQDTSPQLGGNLEPNGFGLLDEWGLSSLDFGNRYMDDGGVNMPWSVASSLNLGYFNDGILTFYDGNSMFPAFRLTGADVGFGSGALVVKAEGRLRFVENDTGNGNPSQLEFEYGTGYGAIGQESGLGGFKAIIDEGYVSIDFGGRELRAQVGWADISTVLWGSCVLQDMSAVTAIDWGSRALLDSNLNLVLNWSTRDTGWTIPANYVSTKTFDADNTTLAELADVLATVIASLQTYGMFGEPPS